MRSADAAGPRNGESAGALGGTPGQVHGQVHFQLHFQLRARLRQLSYGAFCLLVRQLLYRSGYGSVHVVGRLFLPLPDEPVSDGAFDPRRFNPHHGGLDLMALSHTDLATSLTLVQAKQYHGPVPRRFIDELRGAMLRLGADHGLLVTTSHFSDLARDAAAESHLRPIRLVDGVTLAEMMLARELGLRRARAKGCTRGTVRRYLDPGYFESLEEQARRLEAAAREDAARRKEAPFPKEGA